MSKRNLSEIIIALVLIVGVVGVGSAYAVDTPPDMPPGETGGVPGGMQMENTILSHVGATELSSDTDIKDGVYTSTTSGQNALLVSGGTVKIDNISVEKSGDDNGDSADFYGINAAVLVYNGGNLTLTGGEVKTSGAHANGVFALGSGVATLEGTKINTTSNNSGGIMVTGGGTLTANNLEVQTVGNSSAAIRSDRGGGTMLVTGGTYQTDGVGSPAIYSTADISVKDATLVSTASEGVVIEGLNSVSLGGVTLIDTNNTLNGNSETYKNIFIYQSMSGDAEEGTGSFTAKNSEITTNQGDTFFITNTTAQIELAGNTFVNNDDTGVFLRAQSGKWGNSGSNGGQVSLAANDQIIYGDMVLDAVSGLELKLAGESYYRGVINGAQTAGKAEVTLTSEAIMVLEGDTYLTALTNADTENDNIYGNGHTLYVNGVAVAVNGEEPPEPNSLLIATNEVEDEVEMPRGWWRFYLGGGILLLLVAVILVLVRRKGKKGSTITQEMPAQPASSQLNSTQPVTPQPSSGEDIIVSDVHTEVPPAEKPELKSKTDIDVNDITPDDVE